MVKRLSNLADKFELIAHQKFCSAKNQKNTVKRQPTGKEFIEHGAICYLNCANALREALSSLLPLPLETPKRDQK